MQTKKFNLWNEEKKRLNDLEKPDDFFYHNREVWWCSIGANVGVETDGKHESFERPVLVLHKFNKHMFWGVPLTSNERSGEFYTKIAHEGGNSWAILSQLRTWSSNRLLRKVGMVSEKDFQEIATQVNKFVDTNRPRLAAGSRRPKP